MRSTKISGCQKSNETYLQTTRHPVFYYFAKACSTLARVNISSHVTILLLHNIVPLSVRFPVWIARFSWHWAPSSGYRHEQQRFTERFTGGHAHRLPYIKCTHCRPRCQLRTTCNLETAVWPLLPFVSPIVNVSPGSSEVFLFPKTDTKIGINCRSGVSTMRTEFSSFQQTFLRPLTILSKALSRGTVPNDIIPAFCIQLLGVTGWHFKQSCSRCVRDTRFSFCINTKRTTHKV